MFSTASSCTQFFKWPTNNMSKIYSSIISLRKDLQAMGKNSTATLHQGIKMLKIKKIVMVLVAARIQIKFRIVSCLRRRKNMRRRSEGK